VKFDSEAGVVAISLSEASLGNLHSVNNLAARLFSYFSSKEMLSLRVNDIMPEVYSVVHDDILNSFLKNRYKSINQDERLLFGRNRNGFIFPLQLQLRKLSWNTNDELIFIANVTPIKTKTAPVLCIVDLEGDLRNVSSTFSWLFKSTASSSNRKLDNIQVILPSFFKVIEECEEEHLTRY
jgi:PAS domain S-box-containing protein